MEEPYDSDRKSYSFVRNPVFLQSVLRTHSGAAVKRDPTPLFRLQPAGFKIDRHPGASARFRFDGEGVGQSVGDLPAQVQSDSGGFRRTG